MSGADRHDLTYGVEEEFLLLHRSGPHLLPLSAVVAAGAERRGVRLHQELTVAQLETNTAVCWDASTLRGEVVALRTAAATAAREAGARLVAAGVAMTIDPPPSLTDSARYRSMGREFGRLAADNCVCGCHVHVGVADRETAVLVGNHLRQWLPTLLALTANSAVYNGHDTGYASWRTVLWARWPCSGPPPHFQSVEHYDAVVDALLDSGALLDRGMVYWDVRPSAHLPTVEVRVSDIPSTVDETVLLATLVRGLVATAVQDIEAGRPAVPVPQEILLAAYWRGARDGVRGRALDPLSLRLMTFAERLAALLDHIRPALEQFGEVDFGRLAPSALARGNGAVGQRRALSLRGAVADVVDRAARTTVQGLPLGPPESPLADDHPVLAHAYPGAPEGDES